jgi:hypothetical protein
MNKSNKKPKEINFMDLNEINEKIDLWFRKNINNSIVSQNTECYNHVNKCILLLKESLNQ